MYKDFIFFKKMRMLIKQQLTFLINILSSLTENSLGFETLKSKTFDKLLLLFIHFSSIVFRCPIKLLF